MRASKRRAWIIVELGSRSAKCALCYARGEAVDLLEFKTIDVQEEGLLSEDEIAVAVARVARGMGDYPLALVLPEAMAGSQVVDLSESGRSGLGGGSRAEGVEAQIRELTGLTTERSVYDISPLRPFGAYRSPHWITVAREEMVGKRLSPFLRQGLRIEQVTTSGNALAAGYCVRHPDRADRFLVDLGSTHTTLIELRGGQPVHMTCWMEGAETWTEALLEIGDAGFEEWEGRLVRENLFLDAKAGPVLAVSVARWQGKLLRQIEEWRQEAGDPADPASRIELALLGGFGGIEGLEAHLNSLAGPRFVRPVQGEALASLACRGAAEMAAGNAPFSASLLPRSLERMRLRRERVSRRQVAVLVLLSFVAVLLLVGTVERRAYLRGLSAADAAVEEALVDAEAALALQSESEGLLAEIRPILGAQMESFRALETFGRIQSAHAEFEFSLLRFADRASYFGELSEPLGRPELAPPEEERLPEPEPAPPAFVIELILEGDPAGRLRRLGEIVGHLRGNGYFANVDRLVREPAEPVSAEVDSNGTETYALLLTPEDDHWPLRKGGPQ